MAERVSDPEAGQALEKSAGKIGQAFSETLPVIVQLLSSVRRDGFRNRERFQQSEKCNSQRAARQFFDPPEFNLGNVRKWKASRDAAYNRYQSLAVQRLALTIRTMLPQSTQRSGPAACRFAAGDIFAPTF